MERRVNKFIVLIIMLGGSSVTYSQDQNIKTINLDAAKLHCIDLRNYQKVVFYSDSFSIADTQLIYPCTRYFLCSFDPDSFSIYTFSVILFPRRTAFFTMNETYSVVRKKLLRQSVLTQEMQGTFRDLMHTHFSVESDCDSIKVFWKNDCKHFEYFISDRLLFEHDHSELLRPEIKNATKSNPCADDILRNIILDENRYLLKYNNHVSGRTSDN